MNGKIEILNMTIKDFEQIEDTLLTDFDDFWTPEILKSELLSNNKKYLVVKQNNEIIGFAGILLIIPECEIMNIVIKKEKRHNGIGKLLLDKIIEVGKQNGVNEFFLEVNENNKDAIKLYKNAEFNIIGQRKNYYNSNETAILMSKK